MRIVGSVRFGVLGFVAALCEAATANGCTVADPPVIDCPRPDVAAEDPGPAPDPCALGRVVLERVVPRERGRPEDLVASFELPRAGSVCVVVSSPAVLGGTPIAAASVDLDGMAAVAESAFSHHAVRVEQRHELAAGTHALAVRVRSTPGATLRVQLRYAAPRG